MKQSQAMPTGRQGFTLIEILVAVFIFSLVIGGAVTFLISAFSGQRVLFKNEQVIRENSFLVEYMARSLRQAQKELVSNDCITTVGNNYELSSDATRIRFINSAGLCEQFLFVAPGVFEQRSTDSSASNFGSSLALSSNSATVQALKFKLLGESQANTIQPRVTLFLQTNGMKIQTTISQRNLDVQQ